MNGANRDAGAVAGASSIRNPIAAAQLVMERTENVLLDGPGADAFAAAQGLLPVQNSYFVTPRRLRMLRRVLERRPAEHRRRPRAPNKNPADPPQDEEKFGTVGAVVLDSFGDIAAGTTTGRAHGEALRSHRR